MSAADGWETLVRPDAVLWDLDGTLVDSEPLWEAAQYALLPLLGGEWSELHARRVVGSAHMTTARYILDLVGRDDVAPEWVVDQLTALVVKQVESVVIRWMPGARDLLLDLVADGVPCALVSASYRRMIDAVLAKLPDARFVTVIAGDEVTNGKPDPEPYLTAAQRLGVSPSRCVVIEDSLPGAASGNAAGAFVVAVRNRSEIPAAPRRLVRDTLVGTSIAELSAMLLAAHVPTSNSPERGR